jgi:predicted dehydrogenase
MKTFHVGIIGYRWAARAHIKAINAMRQAQVSAVYSSRPLESLQRCAQRGNNSKAYQLQ